MNRAVRCLSAARSSLVRSVANCSPSGGSAASSVTVIEASRYERGGSSVLQDVLARMFEENVDRDAL